MAIRGILSDVNIEGHVQYLQRILEGPAWCDLWASLGLPMLRFWSFCQQQEYILLTGNRNKSGTGSLEETIRTSGLPHHYPVLTVASPNRVRIDSSYAQLVVERFLERVLDIENLRGSGRVWLP